MSFQVNFGERKSQRFSAQSVDGVTLNAIISDGEGSGSGQANTCDWTNVYLQVILNQGGHEHTIVASNVGEIAKAFSYNTSAFEMACDNTSIDYGSGVQANTVFIPFGQTLNLGEKDVLTVEVTPNPNSAPQKGTGYLDCDLTESIGVQFCNPKINVQAIPNGESNYSISLGDNVTNIYLIGNAKSASELEESIGYQAGADQWIQNVRLFSDRYNVTSSKDQLANELFSQFESRESADRRYQYKSFHILDKEVDRCRLQLDLNPKSVTSGQFYIVYTTYEATKRSVMKGLRKTAKHDKYDMKKLSKSK